MDVETNLNQPEEEKMVCEDSKRDDIITFLTHNDSICFKSQQKWEADLTKIEKHKIALDIFEKGKLNFLIKFGTYLTCDQLDYFKQFTEASEPDGSEIELILKELGQNASKNISHINVKNRRYAALTRMVQDDSYFSEIEMMKRNPLLYEQLVGQYLTEDEKRERDKYNLNEKEITFVKILMEGIERDNAEIIRRKQEETEDDQMEEEDTSDEEDMDENRDSPPPCTSRWGEFEENKIRRPKTKARPPKITPPERILLKEEFITTMYQSFLDGNDVDFNYETVDNNTSYDNLEEIDHDEEDKYFASEEPEEVGVKSQESSEDELDMYMNAINQHPSVCQLSQDLKKL